MLSLIHISKMLLSGNTYEQIVKNVEIITATISRINRFIQYGSGGYEKILNRAEKASKIKMCIRDSNNAMRVSRSVRDVAYKAMQARELLQTKLGREPNVRGISEACLLYTSRCV